MLSNSDITIYHKIFDEEKRLEKWVRHNYQDVWFFGGKGAGIDEGYDNANNVNVRIFYQNNDINIDNFAIGDIIVQGTIESDIETQQDLRGEIVYNITSIKNNTFGNNPHLHIGGK